MKDDELFSAVQNNGFFPEKYVRYYSNMPEIHNSVYHATMPVVMVDDITPNPYMSYRIESAGKPVGFATLIQKFRKFRPIDPELFSVFCRAIGNEIRYDIIVADSRKHTYEYLIAELLDKKLDEKKLRERIMQVDLKLRKNLFLMAVERKSEQKNKSYFMEREQRRLEIMIPGSYCTIYRNSLIVLFSCDTDRPFTSKKRKEICSELETYGFTGGISKKFYDFLHLQKAYRQCIEANRLGRMMDKSNQLYEFEDYACYSIFDQLVKQGELLYDYCSFDLLKILAYDCAYKTPYGDTLRTYLETGCSPALTAKILEIHRNTIDYRISRIRDLFGVTIDDHNLLFRFRLTFMILDFIKQSRSEKDYIEYISMIAKLQNYPVVGSFS